MTIDDKIAGLSSDEKRVFIALVLNSGLSKEEAYERLIHMDIYADLPAK